VPISTQERNVGLFEENGDVGTVGRKGSVEYDAAKGTYTVSGGGENMWAKTDTFHFVWKRMSGDISLSAGVWFPESGGNAHRKACLMIRQSLAADSAYVDAALHGDGLTSLQYRDTAGGLTHEIQSNTNGPVHIRIEKHGSYFFMSIAKAKWELRHAGGGTMLQLKEPFYVGLAVCAHDDKTLEKAVFLNVELTNDKYTPPDKPVVESTLETIAVASTDRRAVYHIHSRIEAPNWSGDGKWLYYNGGGRIYKIAREGGEPTVLDTGTAIRCNNDHGLSPDGTQLAISHHGEYGKSRIYVVPLGGGTPRLVTPLGPSYWHGWSPDGKTLAYCAERNGEFDVYSIPAAGGDEKRLTTAPGLDDGPEYTPDGKYIYFNSERTGTMQIWRMKADGSEQEQVTKDEFNNWFAHPSPDGKWIVFLSFEKDVKGHPPDKDVQLRIMPIGGGEIRTLAKLFGGQGTINVPSWSPDSKSVAFVSYRRH
jgi:Tol biopolymer transport system component